MKNKSLWFRILLSGSLFAFLLYSLDFQNLISIFPRINYTHLFLAFIIAIGDRILMAYKWNLLLKAKGIRIPLVNITGVYLITTFLGLFLPATVGGDALRTYSVARDGHRASDVLSSIIIERVLGFLALFVFVLVSIVVSLIVFGESFFSGIWYLFWFFLILLVVSLIAIHISLNNSILRLLKSFFYRQNKIKHSNKVIMKLAEVYQSYKSFQHQMVVLFIFFFLSLIENLFPLFWTFSIALAFDINVPLLYFFILIPIVLVLVRIPISFDGIGIQEGAFVFFLSLIGVVKSEAFLLGLFSHLIGILSVVPGGLLYIYNGLSYKQKTSIRLEGEIHELGKDHVKDII
jgi:glycosyltransferase 2 family protein